MLERIRTWPSWLLLWGVTLIFGSGYLSHALAQPPSPAEFSLEPIATEAPAGGEVAFCIRVRLQPGWHIYSTTMPVDAVGPRPTTIEVTAPQGATIESVEPDRAPVVKFEPAFGLQTEYFEEEVAWTVKVRLPTTIPLDSTEIKGHVRYQLCTEEQCLPPSRYEFSVPVTVRTTGAVGSTEAAAAATEKAGGGTSSGPARPPGGLSGRITNLGAALGFGFLAGLILNVMPCVLPVLSLKVYGFVQQQGVSPRRRKLLAVSFAAGIIVVFLALAVVAMALSLGWGQQFQSKTFVAAMVGLLVAFALAMFDVYTIQLPGSVSRLESELAHEETYSASFAKGMLATVLATPCSGPFLGGVLTFAVQQPPYIVLAVFASIGLGMASPYLVLAWFPGWLRFLPKPGEWMNTMKQAMAFLLFGAAVWLLWVHRRNGEFVVWTVAFALCVAFACWLYGKLAHPMAAPLRRRLAPVAALATIVLGWLTCLHATGALEARRATSALASTAENGVESPSPLGPLDRARIEDSIQKGIWLEYSRSLLDQLLREGYSVIVDWTADW